MPNVLSLQAMIQGASWGDEGRGVLAENANIVAIDGIYAQPYLTLYMRGHGPPAPAVLDDHGRRWFHVSATVAACKPTVVSPSVTNPDVALYSNNADVWWRVNDEPPVLAADDWVPAPGEETGGYMVEIAVDLTDEISGLHYTGLGQRVQHYPVPKPPAVNSLETGAGQIRLLLSVSNPFGSSTRIAS